MRPIFAGLTLGGLVLATCCIPARGDGGTLRLNERKGDYTIAVFTSPTPFRAGLVDVSVLIQDAATGEPSSDAQVTVRASPRGRPEATVSSAATTKASTNKLFHAAVFDLPAPGLWELEIAIDGIRGQAQVNLELDAAAPAPHWIALWPWLSWPALVIAVYAIHQRLVWRKLSTSQTNPQF